MSIDPNRLESAEPLIRSKARRLSRRRGFCRTDAEDIEQELRLHLWRQAAKFNPAITSWESFVSFILDKRCVSLLRHRTADKRSPDREACSLNEPVLDKGGRVVARHETIPEAASTPQRLRDLERDVSDLRARLSCEDARHFMDGLVRGGTTNSMGVELDLARRTAERYYAEISKLFEDASLKEYL